MAETTADAAPPAPPANSAMGMPGFAPPNLALTTLGLALASFMQVLDTTIANVSLPTISGNLGGSANQATWVITSFAVSNAIALPLTGWLTRRYGERKLFMWSTLAFVMASFLWQAAERAEPLPRMPLATKPAETNPFAYEDDDD